MKKKIKIKEVAETLDEFVVVIDKIGSGFSDIEETALALLLFFNEKKVLDKLAYLRTLAYDAVEKSLTKEAFEEWFEQDLIAWKPPYGKNREELIDMIKKSLADK